MIELAIQTNKIEKTFFIIGEANFSCITLSKRSDSEIESDALQLISCIKVIWMLQRKTLDESLILASLNLSTEKLIIFLFSNETVTRKLFSVGESEQLYFILNEKLADLKVIDCAKQHFTPLLIDSNNEAKNTVKQQIKPLYQ